MKKTKENEGLEVEESEILQRLGEKVERAIATIQELRKERDAFKTRAEEAEARLAETDDDAERFRRERGQIRDRIESILSNLESLDS
jgi:FtsZ-binding cell division protein ZapB